MKSTQNRQNSQNIDFSRNLFGQIGNTSFLGKQLSKGVPFDTPLISIVTCS